MPLQRYGFYDKYLNYSEANPDLDMTAPYVAGSGVFDNINKIVGGKYQSRFAQVRHILKMLLGLELPLLFELDF